MTRPGLTRRAACGAVPLVLTVPAAGLLSGCRSPRPGGALAPLEQGAPAPARGDAGATQAVLLPEDGVEALLRFISSATRRLDLYVFVLRDGAVEAAIAAVAGRGVTVRALVEPHPEGRTHEALTAMARLRRAGAEVRPASKAFPKTHAKVLLADGARAWIGSANPVDSWRSTRDFAVVTVEPETVGEVAGTFESDWTSAGASWLGARRGADGGRPAPGTAAALVVSPGNGRAAFTAFLRGATQSLLLEHSRLDDPSILAELAERSRAGVEVALVLDDEAGNARAARRLRRLAPGVRTRLVRAPEIHAKVIVADGRRVLLGSHNLTTESLDRRREISVIVDGAAPVQRLATAVRRDLDGDADRPCGPCP